MKKLLLVSVIVLLQSFLFAEFPGTALEFDGVEEYVNCGNDVSLDITDSITIEAWIYANSWKDSIWEGTIVGKDNIDNTGYNLRCGENGRLSFVNGIAGAWPEIQSSEIMNTGTWYHVAGVYDGISQKIYINGDLVGENATTGTIGINDIDIYIATSAGYAGRCFDGRIDEVRLWSVARTETEINDNMHNSLAGTETGLVAYYEFDEGAGTTLTDTSGSNTGTLNNMEESDWVGSTVPSPSVVLLSSPILFTSITESFNGIDVGDASAPTFTDLDGDGLLDMLVGKISGNINHYEQNTVNSTSFTLVTENFNLIDVGDNSTPTFTDLDGDGLLDMLVGEYFFNINHYEQDSENSTSFTLVTENFNSIDVGNWSTPTFTDLDGDGLLDMLIGELDGNINHYEQNELNSVLFTIATTLFNSIDVGSWSTPTFTDLDGDGLLDMLVGEYDGNISHYEQDYENSTSFTLVTEMFNGIDVGANSAPTFTDFGNDGLLDMLIGEEDGNINHYEQKDISEIDFGNILIGGYFVEDYIVKADNLISNLSIDCTGEGYLISLSENSGYQSSLSIIAVNGTVSDTVFVRFEPTAEQEYTGNISHNSTNMETKNIALSGTSYDLFTDINAGLQGVSYSSVALGDYDNDGDLDILLTGTFHSIIYNNNSGSFTDINAGLEGVYASSVAWGDYDNDNDLDILLTGAYSGDRISQIFRNDSGVFTDINAGLQDVRNGSVAWGDYDNDGDLDILLTGSSSGGGDRISEIYRNDLGIFTDINSGLQDVYNSSVVWGDYDNDGDLDILLTGDTGTEKISKIYSNDSGIFTDMEAGLIGVSNSSVAWGDYDNDGDLDILLSGDTGSEKISKIYRNDSEIFTDIEAGLMGVCTGSVAWGDYNNDGDLDILLTGDIGTESISKIYGNDSGVFTDIGAGLEDVAGDPAYGSNSVAWGDYDNDGDLDILLTGDTGTEEISKIYRNNSSITNTAPSSPSNLSSVVNFPYITFSWDKATDNETPQNGLSYNLYIGSTSQTGNLYDPMSDIGSGYRKVISIGNVGQNDSLRIEGLPDGDYYWSVQAVDHAFAGSVFATEQVSTGINNALIPLTTQLQQNYPNPFNPTTTIGYSVSARSQVELNIYNINGQFVRNLINTELDKGSYNAEFNAGEITSGIYFYDLKIDGVAVEKRKMILIK